MSTPYYERSEWPAFLAAIKAAPMGDLPRLVAADFIEESGDAERAEFVRVCCGRRSRSDDAIARILGGLATWAACGVTDDWSWHGGLAAEPYPDPVGVRVSNGVLIGYDRGFVSSVSAPLGVLHGGECVACNGVGQNGTLAGAMGCIRCSTGPRSRGTGRTPGVLAQLLRREPLMAAGIVVTDREPWENEDGTSSWWLVYAGTSEEPADIEEVIWNRLPKPDGLSTYHTADAARLALGEALYRIHGPKSEVST